MTTFLTDQEARRLFTVLNRPPLRAAWNRDLRARIGRQLRYVLYHPFTPAPEHDGKLCSTCLLSGEHKTRAAHKAVELA